MLIIIFCQLRDAAAMTLASPEQMNQGASPPPAPLSSSELLQIARDCGADDCGLVQIDHPALAPERASVLAAFPATRSLLALVGRMNRESVRSPARSISNLEFHRTGHAIDDIARAIVRRLEDRGIRALNPAMAFPMEMDNFPRERGWVVSHKRVAEAAGLGRMGLHRNLIHPKFGSFVLLDTVLIAAECRILRPPAGLQSLFRMQALRRRLPGRRPEAGRLFRFLRLPHP